MSCYMTLRLFCYVMFCYVMLCFAMLCYVLLCYAMLGYVMLFSVMLCNHIGGVMVSVLASSVVDNGFESRSGQTKDYKIGICCFSAKHAVLRSLSKDWLVRNQINVSEWSDMSIRGLFFSKLALWKSNSAWWSRTKRTSSSSHWKLTCSRHDIAEKLRFGLKQHSLTHSLYVMLCYGVMRCDTLCYAMLWYVTLRYGTLRYAILY